MSQTISDDTVPKARPVVLDVHPLSGNGNFPEALAGRGLSRLTKTPEKVQYEFTQDIGLLHQYYRLREDMFISVWGLKQFCGKEDAHDARSLIMVARQGLHCIAGGRLTVCTPLSSRPLPMERDDLILSDLFPALHLSGRTYGEFSRLAILPEFRNGAVFPDIARRFIRRAIAEGVEYAFNIAPLPLARNYRRAVQLFGVNWEIQYDVEVPDREEYEGIRMVLSVMDLTQYSPNRKAIDDGNATEIVDKILADQLAG